ncbi:MAG: hypothetical protein G01um101456_270 [Parcubacteria group bacterium Gr01-1014_56]|nr:MAG: hypothetical protein G01um101456_270 [Parcubacteria group bacterium Gr01-1014_56]
MASVSVVNVIFYLLGTFCLVGGIIVCLRSRQSSKPSDSDSWAAGSVLLGFGLLICALFWDAGNPGKGFSDYLFRSQAELEQRSTMTDLKGEIDPAIRFFSLVCPDPGIWSVWDESWKRKWHEYWSYADGTPSPHGAGCYSQPDDQ